MDEATAVRKSDARNSQELEKILVLNKDKFVGCKKTCPKCSVAARLANPLGQERTGPFYVTLLTLLE